MKNAVIKVVAVAAMVFTFAFFWVSSPAYALNFPGLNQLMIIKVTNLRDYYPPSNLNFGHDILVGTDVLIPPVPLPYKINQDKKYAYVNTTLGVDFEKQIIQQLNDRNSQNSEFPERYEYIGCNLSDLD